MSAKGVSRSSRRAAIASFLVLTLLAWPVEALAGELSLTWDDRSGSELGFRVERSTETTGGFFTEIAVMGPGVTVYTDGGLADGTTYCYRVQAFNASGYSDYSNVACGMTAQVAMPRPNLALNKESYTTGETISATVIEGNAGDAPIVVDKYFGVLLPASASSPVPCPGGDGIVFPVTGGSDLPLVAGDIHAV